MICFITKRAKFIIIATGFLVYFVSLFNGFVWDDETQIINNGFVHSITNFFTFFKGSTFTTGGAGSLGGIYYKPLMSSAFALLYTFFGQTAFFFHFVQLILHIANAFLVFQIFKKFIPEKLSFFLALIFLVHPQNSESVVYISALQDVLFSFFGLLALYFVTKSAKQHFVVFGLLLSSMLSKETGIVFLFSVLSYILIFKRYCFLKYLIGTISTVSIYLLLRLDIAQVSFTTQHLSPITRIDFTTRLLTIPKIVYFYISSFLFPKNFAIDQQWIVRTITFNDFYLPLIITIITAVLLISGFVFLKNRGYKETNVYLFFASLFVFGLAIHLQIFPLDMTVADRWFYSPMVGLLGLFGVLLSTSTDQTIFKKRENFFYLAAVILTVILSARTFARSLQWKDGYTLFSNDVVFSQKSFDLENNFGVELFRKGQFDGAKTHFLKSTELAPYWWSNWNGLGAIAEREKDFQSAAAYYQKAIDNGNDSLAYENKANLLFIQKLDKEAADFTETTIKKLPYNSRIWFIMSLVNYRLGEYDKALFAANQAYTLAPSDQTYYLYSRLQQKLPIEF